MLASVAERGTGGTGAPGLEVRRQGRRFLLVALLTEWIEAASELSGTWRVDPKEGVVELGGRVCVMDGISLSWEVVRPSGDSTRASSAEGAEGVRSWRIVEDGCGDGCGGGSREGSMMESLLRRDLFEDA